MKKIIFVFLLCCSYSLITFAQEGEIEHKVFTRVEKESEFPGGLPAWKAHLMQYLNANIPVENNAPAGIYNVIIKFIVSKDGSISELVAETANGYGMEKEVMRVILLSAKWTPALQNGRPVNAYRRQPVTFVVEKQKSKKRNRNN